MLMDRLLNQWISLIMVFEKHLQGADWHSKHLSELVNVDGGLLGLKHAWFRGLKFFHL